MLILVGIISYVSRDLLQIQNTLAWSVGKIDKKWEGTVSKRNKMIAHGWVGSQKTETLNIICLKLKTNVF